MTETEILIKAGDSGTEIRFLPIKAHYPLGQATHLRTIRDIGAISLYVISYLMVKWGIEGLRPGIDNTYRGPGTGRDVFCLSQSFDRVFETLTFLTCLPLSILYGLWYYVGRVFSVPSIHSLSGSGIPVRDVLSSVIFLPALLFVSIVDLVGNRLGIHPDITSGFVRRHYANPWRQE